MFEQTAGGDPDFVGGGDGFAGFVENGLGFVGGFEAREGEQSESAAVLKAKNAEIALLEARLQKVSAELEEERRELGGHIDELRRAGQVSEARSCVFVRVLLTTVRIGNDRAI